MQTLTVLAGHPYYKYCGPSVYYLALIKKWKVKWRDFHTFKHDGEFDTEEEARDFASHVCRPPICVTADSWDIEESNTFWHESDAESEA